MDEASSTVFFLVARIVHWSVEIEDLVLFGCHLAVLDI
jgi:hypothetical protein